MNSPSRLAGLLFATAAFVLGQSVHSVANVFKPQATPADSIYNVSMLMLAICAAIFVVVGDPLSRTRNRDGERTPCTAEHRGKAGTHISKT